MNVNKIIDDFVCRLNDGVSLSVGESATIIDRFVGVCLSEFIEKDHPRDHGKFAKKGIIKGGKGRLYKQDMPAYGTPPPSASKSDAGDSEDDKSSVSGSEATQGGKVLTDKEKQIIADHEAYADSMIDMRAASIRRRSSQEDLLHEIYLIKLHHPVVYEKLMKKYPELMTGKEKHWLEG